MRGNDAHIHMYRLSFILASRLYHVKILRKLPKLPTLFTIYADIESTGNLASSIFSFLIH